MSAIGKAPLTLPAPSPASEGFTLIEALVVLAITGLIAGIGFPSVERALRFWQFSEAANATEAGLQHARATALRTGEAVRFAISSDRRSFVAGGEPLRVMPQGVAFASAPDAITYFADGSATGGKLHLVGPSRQRWYVVSPDTGLLGVDP